jgi:hypothetical protein
MTNSELFKKGGNTMTNTDLLKTAYQELETAEAQYNCVENRFVDFAAYRIITAKELINALITDIRANTEPEAKQEPKKTKELLLKWSFVIRFCLCLYQDSFDHYKNRLIKYLQSRKQLRLFQSKALSLCFLECQEYKSKKI